MSPASSGIAIVSSEEELLALSGEWDALWSRVGGNHSTSFDVAWHSWVSVAKPRGRRLVCAVARQQGRLVLVWPLIAHTRLMCTVLRPLGPGEADYSTLLQEPGPEAAALAAQAWQKVRAVGRPDITFFPYVAEDTPLYAIAKRERHVLAATPDFVATAKLREERDFATFVARLPSVGRRTPDRIERRLRKEGEIVVRTLDGSDRDQIESAIDWTLACKRAWAERSGKRGEWLYTDTYRHYLVELASSGARPAAAVLLSITLNGARLAIMMLGLGSSSVTGLMNAYEPEWARLSAGKLMIAQGVKWALEHQLDFDFGVGGEPYKAYWCEGNGHPSWSFEIAHTRWGRISTRLKEAEIALKRRLSGRSAEAGSEEDGASGTESAASAL